MKQAIESFIQSKRSVSTAKSPIPMTCAVCDSNKGEISQQSLLVYQQSLLDLKPLCSEKKNVSGQSISLLSL